MKILKVKCSVVGADPLDPYLINWLPDPNQLFCYYGSGSDSGSVPRSRSVIRDYASADPDPKKIFT